MKRILPFLIALFIATPAFAGEWKFNDFNMAKLDQYSHAEWFSLSGPSVIGFNVGIMPTVTYESGLPTLAFLSFGQGMTINLEGSGDKDAVTVFDFIHFGYSHFGVYKPTEDLGDGNFADGWKFKGGVRFGF